ncbi:MAG TPA: di-heme-cytochrome C peroxidase [Bryobacteraceae bacterium]|nr:di-heme-cytochrome C peroxidase [Bryobacteraceae bacterium]
MHSLYRIGGRRSRMILLALLLIVLFLLLRSTTLFDRAYYRLEENDPARGAATVSADVFGDQFTRVAYLDQGWAPSDSAWFYTTTQGSDLLPYDFFIALEQEKSQQAFRSPENMNRYRYLPQKATPSDPDGLPVGFVADHYRGKKYLGMTCAACHTSQVDYKGVGIRIDGGPAAADMDTFMNDVADAMKATRDDPAKRQRFIAAVRKAGNYSADDAITQDLQKYTIRMQAYNFFNESTLNNTPVPYGYARLDAFGRIFNRVAEHVLNPEALRAALDGALPPDEVNALLAKLSPVLTSDDRDALEDRLLALLTKADLQALRDRIFTRPNAPASYPFLWDISQHDYVQWNGIGANAGVGPLGRNTGEVIGVFATLDWSQKKDWTISSVLGGQGFGKTHISFRSSADLGHLRSLEDRLASLESPLWADAAQKAGLPAIDPQRRDRGEALFGKYCAACHAVIDRASPDRRVVAHMDKIAGGVGTDPRMANNAVDDKGYSGILRNLYSNTSVGNILLDTQAPVAALLTTATENVVATPDPDKWFFTRAADWVTNLVKAYFSNKIKPSVKSGDYIPDSTVGPFESLRSYKGRSLNGIWATAPYLHNGSVPTLYDLLLPAAPLPGDPAGTAYRTGKFMVGSRELEVAKVGFRSGVSEYQGFLFDTLLPANSNAGHEYGTRQMSDQDRWDLVEYLKSL